MYPMSVSHLLAHVSRHALTISSQSLISLAKFTLGLERWSRFTENGFVIMENDIRKPHSPPSSQPGTELTIEQGLYHTRLEDLHSFSHCLG